MLLAAGCVGFENWSSARTEKTCRLGFGLLWGTQVLGSLIAIILMKPIAPINSALWEVTSSINEDVVEMVGWQDLTAQVAEIYQSIPEKEKPRTAILTGNYGEAGHLICMALNIVCRASSVARTVYGTAAMANPSLKP